MAHGDVQAEAGGVQVPGLSPQAGLGCSRQAGGAAACVRQSRKSRQAAFCKEEVGIKAASTQRPGTSQCPNQRCAWVEGRRGARLDRRSLCKRRGGRRQPGSPGQPRKVAERWSGGDAGGRGVWSWERRGPTFTLHPFLLSKPSCSTLGFSKITWVMREKKCKSISSSRPPSFESHTLSSLGGRGHRGPTSTSPPSLCPGADPALTGPQGAVGKTSSVNL